MEFEWDEGKKHTHRGKHRIDFREAETAFLDPLALVMPDEAHSTREQRWILLGVSQRGRLLVTVFTERDNRLRIISSRRATRREARHYEERI